MITTKIVIFRKIVIYVIYIEVIKNIEICSSGVGACGIPRKSRFPFTLGYTKT